MILRSGSTRLRTSMVPTVALAAGRECGEGVSVEERGLKRKKGDARRRGWKVKKLRAEGERVSEEEGEEEEGERGDALVRCDDGDVPHVRVEVLQEADGPPAAADDDEALLVLAGRVDHARVEVVDEGLCDLEVLLAAAGRVEGERVERDAVGVRVVVGGRVVGPQAGEGEAERADDDEGGREEDGPVRVGAVEALLWRCEWVEGCLGPCAGEEGARGGRLCDGEGEAMRRGGGSAQGGGRARAEGGAAEHGLGGLAGRPRLLGGEQDERERRRASRPR